MSIVSEIKDLTVSAIKNAVKEVQDDAMKRVSFRIKRISNRIMRDLFSTFMILIAVVFLALAASFFFIEYLEFTKTLSFLIIGIILILIALIIRIAR